MIILSREVRTMVSGIKNSTQSEGTLKTSRILKANVMECPIVNAVTRIRIFSSHCKNKQQSVPEQKADDLKHPGNNMFPSKV
jgi:hypothetical protein